MDKNWFAEYRGVQKISEKKKDYDYAFGKESVDSDIFVFNYGRLGHPINALAWYLIDDDLKIMYYGFGQLYDEQVKTDIIKCLHTIYPASVGYHKTLESKILSI